MTTEERLTARLTESLGPSESVMLVEALASQHAIPAVYELLQELEEAAPKAAATAVERLPDLVRRGSLGVVVSWLDLGVALAGSSGATALRYCQESPLLLGLLESDAVRQTVLQHALEIADGDPKTAPNMALEFVRKAPELLSILPGAELRDWAEIGLELAQWDYVLGMEFLKHSPAMAEVLPLDHLRSWVGFGMKLVTTNSLGKTDYMGTLEFFRTGPGLLTNIEDADIRKAVVDLGSRLADRDPGLAIAVLADSPDLLGRLPSKDWRRRILAYALFVADQDGEAALQFVRRCPEVFTLLEDSPQAVETFERWFKAGMEILAYSSEGARAYFGLETKQALASLEEAMSGVPLRQVSKSLKLFAQALCGSELQIEPLPDAGVTGNGESAKGLQRARSLAAEATIHLPALLRRYPTREQNLRLYTAMTAHEAGHVEFGTYRLSSDGLWEVMRRVADRYQLPSDMVADLEKPTLADLFAMYPQKGLIQDLWTILEDARIEYLLQQEYPGLKDALASQAWESVQTRSLLHGMTAREMVVDCLLVLSTGGRSAAKVPDALQGVVDRCWARCQAVFREGACAEDSVRAAHDVYVYLEEMRETASVPGEEGVTDHGEEAEMGVGPSASELTTGQYRPITNWVYRGAMNPELIEGTVGDDDALRAGERLEESAFQRMESAGRSRRREEDASPRALAPGPEPGEPPASPVEQWLRDLDGRETAEEVGPDGGRAYLYPEWDGLLADFRARWCRVVERSAPEGSQDFVGNVKGEHGPALRLLRRYFENLRPSVFRWVHGQDEGEDVDLEAAIRAFAERRARVGSGDRVYLRREKRERSVAAAFLVDMSGSTGRQVTNEGQRVIDVEKEGLVLLSEALNAIGDDYAIFGYSGKGRRQVDFLVLKDFDESARGGLASRIGGVTPLQQNRDGAAIRHATAKLLARRAKIRLLLLLSDGRPLDDGYADEYALEDTKMALREARRRGIEPFCITVDQQAGEYLRRMYGEVKFLIIDHVSDLPFQLPRLYRRLTA